MPLQLEFQRFSLPPARPNTFIRFNITNPSGHPLPSKSPFIESTWMQLLYNYPGNLPQVLSNILHFGARIGCTGFNPYNQPSWTRTTTEPSVQGRKHDFLELLYV